jgi:hypothetical protein
MVRTAIAIRLPHHCGLHNGVAKTFAPEARAARRARRRAGKIASCGQADEARAGSGWPLPR